MNTDTILNRNAADNSVKVIGYGHSTPDCIVKLCLDTAGGNLAQAQGLVQRYVIGKAAQQKIIRAIELHVNPRGSMTMAAEPPPASKARRAIASPARLPSRPADPTAKSTTRSRTTGNHAATRRDWVARRVQGGGGRIGTTPRNGVVYKPLHGRWVGGGTRP